MNSEKKSDYKSLDEYVSAVLIRLQTYRDNMFVTYYTNLEIPEAPAVTIDYRSGATRESFSGLYEYSFEGSAWYDCDGNPIEIVPGNVSRYLWVRVKGTAETLTGNTTKVLIPAMPRITGDVLVTRSADSCILQGLKAGTYQYAFTDDKTDETLVDTFVAGEDGEVSLSTSGMWKYLAIRQEATESAFASQIRYLVPTMADTAWTIYPEKKTVVCNPDQATVQTLAGYYADLGYTVLVTDATGAPAQALGTGYVLTLDELAYTVIVPGDVNGDAAVDVFDLFGMVDHLNAKKKLAGVYLNAGCVRDGMSMEQSDVYAEAAYLNGGSFAQ